MAGQPVKASPVTQLVGVKLEMTGGEARALYAELYRLSADVLLKPYPYEGMIAGLMRELGEIGADE